MTLWISHRGESIDAPENTLAAFKLAMERDTDGIETDIHLTADGVLVCCHDSDTIRTCGGESMIIENSTLAELQALDASKDKLAYLGEKLPTFADALKCLKPGKFFYVEIKTDDPRVITAMMAEVEKSDVDKEQIIMISFHENIVRLYKEQYPEMPALWLTGFATKPDGTTEPSFDAIRQVLRETHADGLDVNGRKDIVDAKFVKALKDDKLSVAVWTIDRVEDAKFFIEAGVDAITSNCAAYVKRKTSGK